MRALLDVNVLIALLDAQHIHHRVAVGWLERNIEEFGWASCPLTQNGCIRILSQPGYPNALPPASVAARLGEATATAYHQFWPDSVTMLDSNLVTWDAILSHRQLTDIYLLALAVRNNGQFVTLDRGVPLRAVKGAESRHLTVLPADGFGR